MQVPTGSPIGDADRSSDPVVILANAMPVFDLGRRPTFTSDLRRVRGHSAQRDAGWWDRYGAAPLDHRVELPDPIRRPVARRAVARRIDRAVNDALRPLDELTARTVSR